MSYFPYQSATLVPTNTIPVHTKTVIRDISGRHWIFNPKTLQYQALDMSQLGEIAKIAGPLIVKYVVPFVKELVSSINSSKNETPVPTPPIAHWY